MPEITKLYEQTLQNNKAVDPAMLDQINKDITRTYSNKKYFNDIKGKQGYEKLQRLLITISTIKGISYTQGMNFIAASLLWHCDEDIAFYIIKELFERLDVYGNYKADLSGILYHVDKFFGTYLRLNNRRVYDNLVSKDILPQMIIPEWFVTLGMSMVPLTHHIDIIFMLTHHGWVYLYTVIKNYLEYLYNYYEHTDFSETMGIIKNCMVPGGTKISIQWNRILETIN